ncbi:oxidoreductase [Allomuricauda sp. d1]|uniref:WD40/YVTN/BNR-like repeat-containing protein n=1 Tax=Allomuricauda sp. d1 TaxID=3136725 RepID=UPI0031D4D96B
MKKIVAILIFATLIFSCTEKESSHKYTSVAIQTVFEDSVSIRAIAFLDANTLALAGSNGVYGTVAVNSGTVRTSQMKYHTSIPEFRAVSHTATDFFMLSAGNPALLYKTGDNGRMDLVYKEEGEGVFYDSMKFWNDREGIAVGDTMDGCLSVIITRNGGQSWKKLSCDKLPVAKAGEGAFAASNTNIEIVGDHIWIATTESRIFYSPDMGNTWQVYEAPIVNKQPTQGIYSIDFYDSELGIAFGGDYTKPEDPRNNKAITSDGGQTWKILADGNRPGYKSCVQFIPNSGGEDIVAVGFTGISYSSDMGDSWKELSEEGFYTLRFLNDSVAYAAGKNRISRLTFRTE